MAEFKKAIVKRNGITVKDLIDICTENEISLNTQISVMGYVGHTLVHIATDNKLITLDEVNLMCDDCDLDKCDDCPYLKEGDNNDCS